MALYALKINDISVLLIHGKTDAFFSMPSH